jgi:hypothetical protein
MQLAEIHLRILSDACRFQRTSFGVHVERACGPAGATEALLTIRRKQETPFMRYMMPPRGVAGLPHSSRRTTISAHKPGRRAFRCAQHQDGRLLQYLALGQPPPPDANDDYFGQAVRLDGLGPPVVARRKDGTRGRMGSLGIVLLVLAGAMVARVKGCFHRCQPQGLIPIRKRSGLYFRRVS